MKAELRALGSQVRLDLKIGKQPLFLVTLFIYLSYWAAIIMGNADYPQTVYYFSEMGMFPVVILLAVLLFEREIGGGGMEVIATYPVSLKFMVIRKWTLSLVLTAVAGVGWMFIYRAKFGEIMTRVYPWNGEEAAAAQVGFLTLLLQTLPAYMLLASVAVLGIVWFQKLYGGLVLAFALWMLDTISFGKVLGKCTLYAAYLPEGVSFVANRIILMAISCVCLLMAVWVIDRRERWIGREEE